MGIVSSKPWKEREMLRNQYFSKMLALIPNVYSMSPEIPADTPRRHLLVHRLEGRDIKDDLCGPMGRIMP